MYEAIRAAYPLTIEALRRAGIRPIDAAGVIMSARYGERAGARGPSDQQRARQLIREAVASRPRQMTRH